MNKIKLRRQNSAICSTCKSPDYIYLGRACKAKWGKHEFNIIRIIIYGSMKKFKVISAGLTTYTGDEEYYNARVTSGGYSPEGGYCSILIYGAEEEMSFRFDDPKVYDAIVSAYLSGETIGIVLNARDLA